LSPEEQAKIAAILKQHPRFEQDFKSKMPEGLNDAEQNECCFQIAAVWPDMARGFQGADRKYNHPTWHYINLPSFLVPEDSTMTVKVNQSLDPPAHEPLNQLPQRIVFHHVGKFLLWCLLLLLCWPLAILALVAYPLVWILLIPFRIVGIAVDGVLGLVRGVVMLPARLLRGY
jgi:hypothetical protein